VGQIQRRPNRSLPRTLLGPTPPKIGYQSCILSPGDRAGIQSDAFALAISGDLPLSEYLQLLHHYQNEANDTVWTDLFSNLSSLRRLFSESACNSNLEKFILSVSNKIKHDLGWDTVPGEDESRQSLRGVVLNIRGNCGDESVVQEAKKRWVGFLTDRNSLPADLQSCVFYLAILSGGDAEFNQMISVYKTATLPAQKTTALRCLGVSKNPELIKKGLEYMMSDEVRMQDRFILLFSLSGSSTGRKICWDYVKQNWDLIAEKFSHNLLPRVICYTCEDFTTIEKAKDVEAFFSTHKVDGTERTIAQTLESIHSNAAILSRNERDVTSWLEKFVSN